MVAVEPQNIKPQKNKNWNYFSPEKVELWYIFKNKVIRSLYQGHQNRSVCSGHGLTTYGTTANSQSKVTRIYLSRDQKLTMAIGC